MFARFPNLPEKYLEMWSRKYPNLVRAQLDIISDPNYLVRILFER